jgi:hypothetical protein
MVIRQITEAELAWVAGLLEGEVASKNKESITLMRAVYPLMGERRRARIDEVLALVEKGRG